MSGFLTGRTSLTTVQTGDIAADAVTAAKLPDDVIDSEHYATGSIDPAHLADDAVTLAKMAAGTDGVIITYDASGNPAHVGPGSDGEVLTSTGAGSPPAFEAASSGAYEFVSTAAITTTTTLEVNNMVAGYDYIIQLESYNNTTNAQRNWLRFSDDAGSSFEAGASDYFWTHYTTDYAATDTSDSQIELNGDQGNTSGYQSTLVLTMVNPVATSEKTMCYWQNFYVSDGDAGKADHGGAIFLQGTNAIEDIQFLWSGGSTFKAQGDITVWRRKRS